MDYNGSSNSIVIPVIFQSKKHFKNFKQFNKYFYENLKCNITGSYKWKKVVSEKKDPDNEVYLNEAFGTQENEENEKKYFYNEIFDLLYSTENEVSAIYIVAMNHTLEFDDLIKAESSDIMKIKYKNDIAIPIRKVYLYLTNINSGLLVVEMYLEQQINSSQMEQMENVLENKELMIDNKEIKKFFLGNQLEYKNLFKQKCFVASYRWCDVEEDLQINKYSMKYDGRYMEDQFKKFFSYYFQMFLICIIQKNEILKVSEMNKEIARLNKFGKIRGRVDSIMSEYIKFQNRYDCIECTYNEEGQRNYELIRAAMSIQSDYEKLGKQMESLQSLANVKLEKTQNWILFAIAILEIIIAIVEYMQSFFACI